MEAKRERVNVVVIGAGLAGLSAANKLCQDSTLSVILLEADVKAGGRVKTTEFLDGTQIPLGATYFHGEKGNSLYEYSLNKKIIDESERIKRSTMSTLYITSDGVELPHNLLQSLEVDGNTLLDEFEYEDLGVGNNCLPSSDVSVYDFLYDKQRKKIEKLANSTLHCESLSIFEGLVVKQGIMEGSKYARDVSLFSVSDTEWLEGERSVLYINNPFQSIVDSLVSSLPVGVLQLGKVVESIVWNRVNNDLQEHGAKVIITCQNGDVYFADHVILTVSLGVLKQLCQDSQVDGTSHFFSPPLPHSKVAAIKACGYTIVNKIILRYKEPLVSKHCSEIRLLWKKSDEQWPLVHTHPWIRGVHVIEHWPKSSSITSDYYIVWLVDEDAEAIESVPNDDVKIAITLLLEKFLAKPLPDLLDVRISKWTSPYTRGSYSYNPVHCPLSVRDDLSSPLDGVAPLEILFAGEATSCDQYSTTHAAYDTGIREADRLLKYYHH